MKTKGEKMLRNRKYVFAIFVISVLLVIPGETISQDVTEYQNFEDMTRSLHNLVSSNKNIAAIESIAKTLEGRDVWLVTIANKNGIPLDKRPALFIGGNFEGDHLVGSQSVLAMIEYLVKNYGTQPEVKKSIDEHVYYIIPRVNPDAAELMFAQIKTGRKTNTKPYDGDNDGRMDEDGPEDLNKDGVITVMRIKDDNGLYMIDPSDSRLMKKADPARGESGEYSIYWEGIDNDNDGFINEDPPGGVDINRNFQHDYPYYKDDAGWHMVSEFESRAVLDWIIFHRNVAAILTFGESDNLIKAPNSRGQLSTNREVDLFNFANASTSEAGRVGIVSAPSSGRFGGRRMSRDQAAQQVPASPRRPETSPATTVNTVDLIYFETISEKYNEITGIKEQPVLRDPQGAFFQYGYYQYGVPSFSTPGWGLPSAGTLARGTRTGMDKQFLNYLDNSDINGFVEWTSFNHPELGEVEIGGFTPFEVCNPPAGEIAKSGTKHGEFAVYLTTLFAKVKIAKIEVKNHGGGIFRITAEVENSGYLPTALQHGVVSRSVKPTMVQLGVDPEQILSGSSKTNFFQKLDGSGKRQKYEWLIKGQSGDRIELQVVAQKAGTDTKTIVLK
ncbi:M14 family metallopeptidase [Acidobacteriota bacterium]